MFSSQETPITRLDASRGIRPNRLQLVGAVEVAEAKEEPAEKIKPAVGGSDSLS
ncbi:unnamed protein product, partial [Nesidiocoris tenuis]